MERQQDYVLRTVEERGIRFIQLWFTDVLGTAKSFNITPAELENALEEGMTFDGSAIDGFSRVQESDVLAKPDPRTFQILPLRRDPAVAVAAPMLIGAFPQPAQKRPDLWVGIDDSMRRLKPRWKPREGSTSFPVRDPGLPGP